MSVAQSDSLRACLLSTLQAPSRGSGLASVVMDILALFATGKKPALTTIYCTKLQQRIPDRAPVTPSLPSKHLARRGLQKDTAAADDTK